MYYYTIKSVLSTKIIQLNVKCLQVLIIKKKIISNNLWFVSHTCLVNNLKNKGSSRVLWIIKGSLLPKKI